MSGGVRLFLDSSASAKRFVEEPGSGEVDALCQAAAELGLSVLCAPEVVSALNRRLRERSLTRPQYREAKQRLLEDIQDADIVGLTPQVVALALDVMEASPSSATDALRIACALAWEAELFASADKQQLRAASRAGLKTRQT